MESPISPFENAPVRSSIRFPLHLEITVSTEDGDCQAVTENVSSNGMFFVADWVPAVGSRIEFRLKMPAAIMGGADDVLLHCVGRIVRHATINGKPGAAAVIDEYTLKAQQA